ncbi:MAG: DUF309 domain-containing protein [Myxococcaceae bacterium]
MNSGFDGHLARGGALFNASEPFAAHVAWEVGWLAEGSDERMLLQGLIQVAAALVKLERAEPLGAQKLLARAVEKLRPFVGRSHGVDLEALLPQLEGLRARCASMTSEGRGEVAPEELPRLVYTPRPG